MSVVRFTGEKEVIPCLLQLSNDSHLYKHDNINEPISAHFFNVFCTRYKLNNMVDYLANFLKLIDEHFFE